MDAMDKIITEITQSDKDYKVLTEIMAERETLLINQQGLSIGESRDDDNAVATYQPQVSPISPPQTPSNSSTSEYSCFCSNPGDCCASECSCTSDCSCTSAGDGSCEDGDEDEAKDEHSDEPSPTRCPPETICIVVKKEVNIYTCFVSSQHLIEW